MRGQIEQSGSVVRAQRMMREQSKGRRGFDFLARVICTISRNQSFDFESHRMFVQVLVVYM